jgi:hypothetical protein
LVVFKPLTLYSGEQPPATIRIGGWMGTIYVLRAIEKKKLSLDGNRTPAVQTVACRYID